MPHSPKVVGLMPGLGPSFLLVLPGSACALPGGLAPSHYPKACISSELKTELLVGVCLFVFLSGPVIDERFVHGLSLP